MQSTGCLDKNVVKNCQSPPHVHQMYTSPTQPPTELIVFVHFRFGHLKLPTPNLTYSHGEV